MTTEPYGYDSDNAAKNDAELSKRPEAAVNDNQVTPARPWEKEVPWRVFRWGGGCFVFLGLLLFSLWGGVWHRMDGWCMEDQEKARAVIAWWYTITPVILGLYMMKTSYSVRAYWSADRFFPVALSSVVIGFLIRTASLMSHLSFKAPESTANLAEAVMALSIVTLLLVAIAVVLLLCFPDTCDVKEEAHAAYLMECEMKNTTPRGGLMVSFAKWAAEHPDTVDKVVFCASLMSAIFAVVTFITFAVVVHDTRSTLGGDLGSQFRREANLVQWMNFFQVMTPCVVMFLAAVGYRRSHHGLLIAMSLMVVMHSPLVMEHSAALSEAYEHSADRIPCIEGGSPNHRTASTLGAPQVPGAFLVEPISFCSAGTCIGSGSSCEQGRCVCPSADYGTAPPVHICYPTGQATTLISTLTYHTLVKLEFPAALCDLVRLNPEWSGLVKNIIADKLSVSDTAGMKAAAMCGTRRGTAGVTFVVSATTDVNFVYKEATLADTVLSDLKDNGLYNRLKAGLELGTFSVQINAPLLECSSVGAVSSAFAAGRCVVLECDADHLLLPMGPCTEASLLATTTFDADLLVWTQPTPPTDVELRLAIQNIEHFTQRTVDLQLRFDGINTGSNYTYLLKCNSTLFEAYEPCGSSSMPLPSGWSYYVEEISGTTHPSLFASMNDAASEYLQVMLYSRNTGCSDRGVMVSAPVGQCGFLKPELNGLRNSFAVFWMKGGVECGGDGIKQLYIGDDCTEHFSPSSGPAEFTPLSNNFDSETCSELQLSLYNGVPSRVYIRETSSCFDGYQRLHGNISEPFSDTYIPIPEDEEKADAMKAVIATTTGSAMLGTLALLVEWAAVVEKAKNKGGEGSITVCVRSYRVLSAVSMGVNSFAWFLMVIGYAVYYEDGNGGEAFSVSNQQYWWYIFAQLLPPVAVVVQRLRVLPHPTAIIAVLFCTLVALPLNELIAHHAIAQARSDIGCAIRGCTGPFTSEMRDGLRLTFTGALFAVLANYLLLGSCCCVADCGEDILERPESEKGEDKVEE